MVLHDKVAGLRRVQLPPGYWVAPSGSNASSRRSSESFEIHAHASCADYPDGFDCAIAVLQPARQLGRIILVAADSPTEETPMHKLSPFLFVIVLCTSLIAQSKFVKSNAAKDALTTAAKYCANVEDYSDSQVPRIVARITSALGQSTGWVEFDSRAAWNRAGRPKPVALVWYRDAKIVRVAIAPNDGEKPQLYADYCYRQDGTLARLRSMPRVQRSCEQNRYQCSLVLRQERWYLPEEPVLKTFGYLEGVGYVNGATPALGAIDDESLQPERTVETFVPMNWPEYRRVTDLPFSDLLYATLR
jgi:hypothetical protein